MMTHQHFPNCCSPHILVYVVASNTTSHLLFTGHLFGMQCDLLDLQFNAHHTTCNYFRSISSVRKLFYVNIFWMKIYKTKKKRITVE